MTVRIPLTDDYMKRALAWAVPGAYWDTDARTWVVDDPDARTASIVCRLFPNKINDFPELGSLRDTLARDARPFDHATDFDYRVTEAIEPAVAPFDFQDLDVGYVTTVLETHGGAYVGWERGLGKTLAAALVIQATDARQTLVCCPNTAKGPVWASELARFLPDHTVVVLPNPKAKRERVLALLADDFDGPLVLVVHYEALSVIAGKGKTKTGKTSLQDGWKALGTWDLFVCDEAHRLSSTKTQLHKAACKVPSRRRLALSGTSIQNHGEDLFGQLKWLFPQTYKSKWRDWNDRFLDFVETDYGKVFIGFKLDRVEALRRELGVFMVYRRKEDELDLPERTEQTLMVSLSQAQRAAYDGLRDDFWTQLEDGTVLKATNVLSQLNLLRRVATGLDTEGRGIVDSTKLDLAMDLIQDSDEPVVVFSWYKAPNHALAGRLARAGVECFLVDGDVKQEHRQQHIEAFMAGERRVFLGTFSTLGESVNLQRATQVITLDRPWNPAVLAQAVDRVYRYGQDRPVTITHIVAESTVDELRVQPVLASKDAMREALFGGSR